MTIPAQNPSNAAPTFFNFAEFKENTYNTITSIPTKISNLFSETQVQIQEKINSIYTNSTAEQYVNSIKNNETLNGIKDSISSNSALIGGTTTVIGGYVAADATTKLLRMTTDKKISVKAEIIKLSLATSAIIAAESICPAADRTALTYYALGGALMNTGWKAVTNPVTHHFYVLKSGN